MRTTDDLRSYDWSGLSPEQIDEVWALLDSYKEEGNESGIYNP